MGKYMKPLHDLRLRILATDMRMSNVMKAGKNWKEFALTRIPETLKQLVTSKPFQLGSGIRRRRINKKKKKKKRNGIYS